MANDQIKHPGEFVLKIRSLGAIQRVTIYPKEQSAGRPPILCDIEGSAGDLIGASFPAFNRIVELGNEYFGAANLTGEMREMLASWDRQETAEKLLYEKLHRKWGVKDADLPSGQVQEPKC